MLGGLGAVVVGFQNAPRLWDYLDRGFEFEPMASPPGFRRFTGQDDVSLAQFFAGIGEPDPRDVADDIAVAEALCEALFHPGEGVPVAAFSDYYCPYCRVLDARVQKLADEGLISLRHHETPVFGPRSEWAARGAIAARAQGAGRAYFERLSGTVVIATPPYLREVAEDLGLDVVQFAESLTSEETEDELRRAASLQRLFGFIGTPALVVGRTVIQGAISETNLRQLIDIEREQSAQHPCA